MHTDPLQLPFICSHRHALSKTIPGTYSRRHSPSLPVSASRLRTALSSFSFGVGISPRTARSKARQDVGHVRLLVKACCRKHSHIILLLSPTGYGRRATMDKQPAPLCSIVYNTSHPDQAPRSEVLQTWRMIAYTGPIRVSYSAS